MNQKRTPAGIPTGGEFAANAHDEAAADLTPRLTDEERLEQGVGFVAISLDDNEPEDTVREIVRQVENGNTSGYYPTWEVSGVESESKSAIIVEMDGKPAQETLDHIASQIEDGMTSGHYPNWRIEREDEPSTPQSEHVKHIAGMLSYSEVEDDGDDKLVIIRDPSLPDVYVISVDEDGNTSSATIDKRDFVSDQEAALRDAEWETGYDA